jgi:hypothetical protein
VQLASLTVPIALLLIAATGVVHCWRDVEAFEPARAGNDVASVMRKRLAPVRAELASSNLTSVDLAMADVELGRLEGAPQAVLDVVAAALHRQLTTGVCEPPPGLDTAGMNSLAAFFRASFPSEQNADPAAVRTHLRDWWVKLVSAIHETEIEYGLAPIVVHAGAPWLVGVFEPGVDHQALAQRRGLTVVRDFGDGIVLFREGR